MIFFIDPMSYRNLEKYDLGLLESYRFKTVYFCSDLLSRRIGNPNVTVKKIYKYNNSSKFIKPLKYMLSQVLLLVYCLFLKPKAVHFQWVKAPSFDYYIMFLIHKLGIKIIYTAHNVLPHDSKDKYLNQFSKIYTLVDRIICHADETKSELMSLFSVASAKISVVPHGIDFARSIINVDKSNEGKVVFSIVGGINAYKGIVEFVDVWCRLSSKCSSFRKAAVLYIRGKCNSKSYSKAITSSIKTDNVIFSDNILSDEDFVSTIMGSSYIVLPYIKISQSGVLADALARRKKVLVSDAGGLDDVLKYGVGIGFSWERGNLEDVLASAVVEEFNIENYANWQKLEKDYNWETVSLRTQSIYEATLDFEK
ncbi:glycosyltransferase family 4 protein [Plesiomonas shigelloides]|uniref:glycosyltransferase family 4 protein n=1 Tax=Plesiomonas shigelloides TaxID=703 RepID=UPI00387F0D70